MEGFEKDKYLQFYAEGLLTQYESKEFSDMRVLRKAAEDTIYIDFINAVKDSEYVLKSQDYIDLIYMMAMARDMRIDRNVSLWINILLKNNDFRAKLEKFIVDIEERKTEKIEKNLDTDQSRLEYMMRNEPASSEINWERYLKRDRIPKGSENNNISTQTKVYAETREAYEYMMSYIGNGRSSELNERQRQFDFLRQKLMEHIRTEDGKIKTEIKLEPVEKEYIPLLKVILRNGGRLIESIEETDDEIIIKVKSVLEKEFDEPEQESE